MKQYAIRYTRIPTHYNDTYVAVVEAETPEDAAEVLKHSLGDHSGVRNHVYAEPVEYIAPVSKGKVITQQL